MFKVGDTVEIGPRLGAEPARAVIIGILPGIGDRVAMYRVRFDIPAEECWVDESVMFPESPTLERFDRPEDIFCT